MPSTDAELGRVLVGDPAEIERRRRAIVLAAGRQDREVEPGARRRIRQRPVGAEQVDIAERRRLVERGVFEAGLMAGLLLLTGRSSDSVFSWQAQECRRSGEVMGHGAVDP